MWVRGYVSVAFDCPYSGPVDPGAAVAVATRLLDAGCAEIAIADTIGSATVDAVGRLLDLALKALPANQLAMHFHDTHGRAIENVAHAYARGIRVFDASAGGLGGCPFAPGAAGNLATETLVGWAEANGVATGIDRGAVSEAVTALRTATVRQ
jgi:isopropylmalate/homocitrate/citramalate synthase